jgi:hypothetical protein
VLPDDVKRLAVATLGHRVQLRAGGGTLDEARAAIRATLARVPVPV